MKNHTSETIIRAGGPDDFQAVRELDRQLIAHDLQFDASLDAAWSESEEAAEFFNARLADDGVCFVAEKDGQVVGAALGCLGECASYRQAVSLAELETLFVSPTLRGGGVGKLLVSAFREWAKGHGAQRVSIRVSATNRDAIAFYERLGFAAYDLILEADA
ncbi:GNAT family N-acetyltransferase [Cerasicoccus fimbriatus]|uniref:GNAT family N-acetyltransferase n=1 Tax=Cerasicoccus fimbriatus TaxID=3014554 RepID=UPI0022B2C7CB|nr:GNAT family N-acetyltransferase [Cerasicoccus sp. TK19100]